MMTRQWLHRSLVAASALAVLVFTTTAAHAQVVQVSRGDARNAVGFNLGYFALRGLDSRAESGDDTIANDLDELAFDIKDFNGATFGGEYLFGIGDFLEAGFGVGFYQRTVPSVYRNLVNENGSEIQQDLKLRLVPITATVRFLPIGRGAAVEPYVGAGIGFFNFRYSEIGDFVDADGNVFSNRSDPYIADGTAVGPVVLGGVRFPVADAVTIGGELRWQKAKGDTGGISEGFLGDKIDLGGLSTSFTLHLRF